VWRCFLGIDVNVSVGFPSHFRDVEIAGEVVGLCASLLTTWGQGPIPGFRQLLDPCHTQT
jgi:hypothetical protein